MDYLFLTLLLDFLDLDLDLVLLFFLFFEICFLFLLFLPQPLSGSLRIFTNNSSKGPLSYNNVSGFEFLFICENILSNLVKSTFEIIIESAFFIDF